VVTQMYTRRLPLATVFRLFAVAERPIVNVLIRKKSVVCETIQGNNILVTVKSSKRFRLHFTQNVLEIVTGS